MNERIFGRCNHNVWSQFQERSGRQMLTCDHCGEEFTYTWGDELDDPPTLKPDEFLHQRVRPYSHEDILANLTIRQIEAGGWSVLVKQHAGRFMCEISRGAKAFVSSLSEHRPAAVCEAAAQLGKSGLFKVPE